MPIYCSSCKGKTPDLKPQQIGNHLKAQCSRCGRNKAQLSKGHSIPKRGPSKQKGHPATHYGIGNPDYNYYQQSIPSPYEEFKSTPSERKKVAQPQRVIYKPTTQRPRSMNTASKQAQYQGESEYEQPEYPMPRQPKLAPVKKRAAAGFMVPGQYNPDPARAVNRPVYEGGEPPVTVVNKKRKGGALVPIY
jgi:hypothetical protein